MRRMLKLFTSRLFWASLIILVQFVFMCYIVLFASKFWGWGYIFMGISILAAFLVFTRNDAPAYKAVWMFLICIFPVFGGVIYLVSANKKIGRLSGKKIEMYRRRFPSTDTVFNQNSKGIPDEYKRLATYISNRTGYGPWTDTSCEYFTFVDNLFLDVLREVEQAEKFVFIEFFIIDRGYWWTRILKVLREKIKEGVDVRVIYDDLGSINSLPRKYDKYLNSLGLKCIAFNKVRMHYNPRLNFRDHRKILCVDGRVCYTGGLNIADEYSNDKVRFGYWKDDGLKITGMGVAAFTYMFLELWACLNETGESITSDMLPGVADTDGTVIPFADNPMDNVTIAKDVYTQVISSAKKYVWITTPYLIPDDEFSEALIVAASSGVDVRIIVPHYPDKRSVYEVTLSNYDELIKGGVKIYEYIPGFIHSKVFIADDRIAVIGTANIDYRSFYLHFELSVVFMCSSIVQRVKSDYDKSLEFCVRQTMENRERIGLPRRALRYFLKLFSPAL